MSKDLTKLAEEALADDAKATPGPWGFQLDEYGRTQDICTIVDGEEVEAIVITDSGVYPPRPPDAQFIASARTREPLLAAGLLASLAECAALRGKLADDRDRLVTFIDEALGMQPVVAPEAVIDLLESEHFEYRKKVDAWLNERDDARAEVEHLRSSLDSLVEEFHVVRRNGDTTSEDLEATHADLAAARSEVARLRHRLRIAEVPDSPPEDFEPDFPAARAAVAEIDSALTSLAFGNPRRVHAQRVCDAVQELALAVGLVPPLSAEVAGLRIEIARIAAVAEAEAAELRAEVSRLSVELDERKGGGDAR